MQCAQLVSMLRSKPASVAACWQDTDGMQAAVQPHPKALCDLPCTLTYPVVAEVPGEDGRGKGAGRVHPRTSVIHLQKTQLQLRHSTRPFQPLFFTAPMASESYCLVSSQQQMG